MHYYKFNIADWSLSTSHLSLEEEAIYFRLINHYYDTESPIPLETHSVFRRLRLGSDDETALAILGEFFVLTDNGWIHKRCEEILKEYKKSAKKNKANGAKGGRPSKIKASEQTQKKPSGFSEETQTEPKHNPNQEPLTINQEPLTNVKEYARGFFQLTDSWKPNQEYWEGKVYSSGLPTTDYKPYLTEFICHYSGHAANSEIYWIGKLISWIKRDLSTGKTKQITQPLTKDQQREKYADVLAEFEDQR